MKAYQFLKNNGITIAMLVGLVISILSYVTILGGMPDLSTVAEGDEKGKREILYAATNFDFTLSINIALSAIAFLFLLVFFGLQIARDPKGSMKSLIMLCATVVLYLIFSYTGSDVMTPEAIKMGLDGATMQRIDAYLYLTYIFTGISILTLVAMFVYNLVRNR